MAVLVTGFIGVRVLAAVDLDPDRIAIAPLRVSGAQGDLAFLSSGLVENRWDDDQWNASRPGSVDILQFVEGF